jgi:radical SAM protein with 4Fe4S-binding SPASM domain
VPVVSTPEISLRDLATKLRCIEHRIPIDGVIEPTSRCNLACVHCYVRKPAASLEEHQRELPLGRWRALIDEIAEAGCLCLLLTGGEPLLRLDFPEIYLHAIRRGLLVTVFTNGTLISEAIADLFADYRPEGIEITLYGMTAETYERITGASGSFARCLAGIERLAARRLPLKLKTMALAWNRHEVEAMAAFARRLGARFVYDCHLNARTDGAPDRHAELQLDTRQILALDHADSDAMKDLKEFCARLASPGPPASGLLFSCGAAETTFLIDAGGTLLPCLLVRRGGYDLRNGGFLDGWTHHLSKFRAQPWSRPVACRTCTLAPLCASCPGAAELEHGDPEALVEAFCRIAHARGFAAMGQVAGHRPDATCCLGNA